MDTTDKIIQHFKLRLVNYLKQLLLNHNSNNTIFQNVQYLDADLVSYAQKYNNIDTLVIIGKILDAYKNVMVVFFKHSSISSHSPIYSYRTYGISFSFSLNLILHMSFNHPRKKNQEIN